MSPLWTVEIGEPDYLDGIRSGVTVFAEGRRPVAYAFRADEGRVLATAPALLEALKGLMVLECPITGTDPFGPDVKAHWLEQKAQGHGYAHLYLAALAAITAATPPASKEAE